MVPQTPLAFQDGKGYSAEQLRKKSLGPLPLNEGWMKRADAQSAEMETGKEVKLSLCHSVWSSVRKKVSVLPGRVLGLLS